MKNITIKSSRLARKVIQENYKRYQLNKDMFILKDIKPNPSNKERSMFIYEYHIELESLVKGYTLAR